MSRFASLRAIHDAEQAIGAAVHNRSRFGKRSTRDVTSRGINHIEQRTSIWQSVDQGCEVSQGCVLVGHLPCNHCVLSLDDVHDGVGPVVCLPAGGVDPWDDHGRNVDVVDVDGDGDWIRLAEGVGDDQGEVRECLSVLVRGRSIAENVLHVWAVHREWHSVARYVDVGASLTSHTCLGEKYSAIAGNSGEDLDSIASGLR